MWKKCQVLYSANRQERISKIQEGYRVNCGPGSPMEWEWMWLISEYGGSPPRLSVSVKRSCICVLQSMEGVPFPLSCLYLSQGHTGGSDV